MWRDAGAKKETQVFDSSASCSAGAGSFPEWSPSLCVRLLAAVSYKD